MKISILASGSRGDVQPYVALGKGLKAAGHAVSILTPSDFQTLIADAGLDGVDMGGSTEAVAQSLQGLVEKGDLLRLFAAQGRAAQQVAHQTAARGLVACQGADAIVAGLGGLFAGLALSEKLNLPLIQAHLMPFTPTRDFGSVLAPLPQTPLTRWANGPSHRVTQQMMWQMSRAADTRARAEVLGLAPAPFTGPFAALRRQTRAVLYGYSPQVLPRPSDWEPSIHVTGYWFLEPPVGWEPPVDLVNFLQAGPPPVYVGFGSMSSRAPEAAADLVVRALAGADQRGLLYGGWGGLRAAQLPETVFMAGSLPHSWLFRQMAAVVHHGGAGTTAAGLAAGVPSIVTPFFGDQPFWGQRVYELGVGPKPILRRRLSVDGLAAAIRQAVSDPAMRRRAAQLGERIRAEDGVARAVAAIEQALAHPQPTRGVGFHAASGRR